MLQHADNPVDWWEWGPEAFAEAKRRNVPILLSVGYAACHWCHVMAHESFEDQATADYLNEHYVSIKVDREERPDVDAVYMQATTAMTGQGGWPMTVVMDHEGAPFFAGTYLPDQPRHGSPSFTQVLRALSNAWETKGDDVRTTASNVAEHLRREASLPSYAITSERIDAAVATLSSEFDAMAGGFGNAPKFPPSMVLEFLRRQGGQQARHMLARTKAAMAGSGMYDQVGGGFARYAVDRGWVVPHFEKMLYDNAQAAGALRAPRYRAGRPRRDRDRRLPAPRACAPSRAGSPRRSTRTARSSRAGTRRRGCSTSGRPPGWSPSSGPTRGRGRRSLFGVTAEGTFEHGTSTLQAAPLPGGRGRPAALGPRPPGAVRRPREASAPGARRQGGRRLERPGDQRAGGRGPPAGPPGLPRRSPGGGRGSCCASTCTTTGCSGCPAMAPPARTRACWRTTGAWRRASWPSRRRPPTRAGSPRRPPSSTPRWTGSPPRTAGSSTPTATRRPW
ncbi:DUF255 domain-containing protein [Nocardioides convexus]|uniref:thioredoxin domain-containing protein n=1 Tax=Nocardioides convexus TaxID=2712224 RepID=UPI002418B3D0|nr:DUF255 domain-containing protein [Nocardioides convexus]